MVKARTFSLVLLGSFAALLLFAACEDEGLNLLQDASFEAGDINGDGVSDGWMPFLSNSQIGQHVELSLDAETRRDGILSQRIRFVDIEIGEKSSLALFQPANDAADAEEGEVWTFALDIFAPTLRGVVVKIGLRWLDGTGVVLGQSNEVVLTVPNREFEREVVTVTAPEGAARAGVSVVVDQIDPGDDLDLFLDTGHLSRRP